MREHDTSKVTRLSDAGVVARARARERAAGAPLLLDRPWLDDGLVHNAPIEILCVEEHKMESIIVDVQRERRAPASLAGFTLGMLSAAAAGWLALTTATFHDAFGVRGDQWSTIVTFYTLMALAVGVMLLMVLLARLWAVCLHPPPTPRERVRLIKRDLEERRLEAAGYKFSDPRT